MTAASDINSSASLDRSFLPAMGKFLQDVQAVMEMKFLFLLRSWYWFLIRPLVFPLGVLFWLRVMLPDDPVGNTRVLAGAIVFGVSLSTANMLSQQIVLDRYLGRLKLLITMPISKSAYAMGVLVFSAVQAIPIVVVTAKDITEEDRQRLNGGVVGLIEKGGVDRESLLSQLREQLAAAGVSSS